MELIAYLAVIMFHLNIFETAALFLKYTRLEILEVYRTKKLRWTQ